MKDVKFCLAFVHDPGRSIPDQEDRGARRHQGHEDPPGARTMASWITQLGGTNVQAAAPEVRDIIEKGVADAVTFPWGSVPLFGIDKVTKYHMEAPLYVDHLRLVINKEKYDGCRAAQKKVIDDHCTTEWAVQVWRPMGGFRARRHRQDQGRAGPRGLS